MRVRVIVSVGGKVRVSVNVSISIRVTVKARVNVRLGLRLHGGRTPTCMYAHAYECRSHTTPPSTSKVQRRQCSVVRQTLRQLLGSLIADAFACKPYAGALTVWVNSFLECIRTFTPTQTHTHVVCIHIYAYTHINV